MDEKTLTLSLSAEIEARLATLAAKEGKSMDDLLHIAVNEFVERWEDYHRAREALEAGTDAQLDLKAVNG
jgi:predicted DNA-binding protein